MDLGLFLTISVSFLFATVVAVLTSRSVNRVMEEERERSESKDREPLKSPATDGPTSISRSGLVYGLDDHPLRFDKKDFSKLTKQDEKAKQSEKKLMNGETRPFVDLDIEPNEAVVRFSCGYALFGGSRRTRERYAEIFRDFVERDRMAGSKH